MKIRTYVDLPLKTNDKFELPPNIFRHLIKVLRLSINDEFYIFNGQGGNFKAQLISVDKKKAMAQIGELFSDPHTNLQKIHLAQAVSRGDRMDFALQKAVELGVNEITPVFSDNSTVKLREERLQNKIRHWQEVIISATEQCGRTDLAILNKPLSFSQLVTSTPPSSHKIILDPSSDQSFASLGSLNKGIQIMIGPESGFTQTELNLAQECDFIPIKLGPRVLRTETATMAAITTIQVLFGDMA